MKNLYWLAYAGLFATCAALLPRTGYGPDLSSWVVWTRYIQENGLGHAYNMPDNNYHPLYLYVLWLYGKWAPDARSVDEYLYHLRLLTLPFDFAGALTAASLLKRPAQRFTASLLLLLNVAYLYNTLVWGQVDAIYTCFVFVAFVCAVRQRAAWSMWFYVLALNTKLQAVIFLPGLVMLWLPLWLVSWKQLRQGLLGSIALQLLILVPFVRAGGFTYLHKLLSVGKNAVGYYPYASLSAYNIWYLLLGSEHVRVSDALLWQGISYRGWGMLLFALGLGVVLLPLLASTVKRIRTKTSTVDTERLLIAFALVPLAFCFFNTQMHERYWHSALLFLAAYGFVSGRYLGYALASGAYYLNLNNVLRAAPQFLPVPEKGVALLFAAVIVWGIFQLYRPAAPMTCLLRLAGPASH